MLPGTKPPPNTRFSSWSCISIRGSSCDEISFSRNTLAASRPLEEMVSPPMLPFHLEEDGGRVLNSLNVFHWPHAGHLPIHLADSCPQFSQTYIVFSLFAIIADKGNHYFSIIRCLRQLFLSHAILLQNSLCVKTSNLLT